MTDIPTRTYTVEGMSCEHCRASVDQAVAEIAAVDAVEIDLATGRLEVGGAGVDDEEVRAAVERAGYRLA